MLDREDSNTKLPGIVVFLLNLILFDRGTTLLMSFPNDQSWIPRPIDSLSRLDLDVRVAAEVEILGLRPECSNMRDKGTFYAYFRQ